MIYTDADFNDDPIAVTEGLYYAHASCGNGNGFKLIPIKADTSNPDIVRYNASFISRNRCYYCNRKFNVRVAAPKPDTSDFQLHYL